MACPILDIEAQQNAKKAEADSTMDKIHMVDTTLNILSLIKKYGDDLGNPRFKDEVASVLEQHQTSTAGDKLKRANDLIYKNTGLQRATQEYKIAMEKAVREANATGNFQGTLGAITSFLNKQFKSYTVSLSLGRFINESSQAGLLAFTNKISQLTTSPFRKERFASMLGLAEDKMPKPGFITKESFQTREFQPGENIFGGRINEEQGKILDTLDKPAAKLRELGGRFLDKSVGRIEQFFYETEFYRAMGDYVTKNGKEASSFLWKDNITSQNKAKRDNLIQQWKREARDSTKTAFFDYSNNPLIINKLETFVPFTNFMYNGVKLLNKYPATFLFGATLLNNAQYAWGDAVQYVDDDGQAIDAGQSLRLPILASLGLDQVALNMNRMLQITPGSLGVKPLPIYNFLTAREDPRFKKFYKSGTFADYADIGLSLVSPPLQKVVGALVNWDKNKDIEGKSQNSLADLNESIAYLTTGVVFKDKTTSQAWQYYINKDYDSLMNLSQLQRQRFFQQDSMVKKGITEGTIKGLKKAKDLGLLDFTNNPYENAIVTLSGLPMHESIGSEQQLREDGDMVRNLAQVALGKQFIDKNYEDSYDQTLGKWKEMYADKNFKEFAKAMPGYADTIKHFVENERYYSDRSDAYKLRSSKDANDKITGELKLLALNYRFKGDEGMSINEKVAAMKAGKLDSPLFYGKNENGIPAHSVVMTDEYLSSLEHKGAVVAQYMEKTNAVGALNQARSVFYQMAFAANSKADKNKYFDLAKKMYNMSLEAEHELKVTGTPEYALFQLSPDYSKLQSNIEKSSGKNYSVNTGWSSTYVANRSKVIENTKNQKDAQQKALISKLNSLSPEEVTFMQNVMKTDAQHRANSFEKMMKETQDTSEEMIQDKGYLDTLFNK